MHVLCFGEIDVNKDWNKSMWHIKRVVCVYTYISRNEIDISFRE